MLSDEMNTEAGFYSPNQPYNQSDAFQIPSTILEPADIDTENGVLRLGCRPFSMNVFTYGNPQFLRSIAIAPIQPASYAANKYKWTYQARHSAQPILPFLHLGCYSAARDATYMTENGITMVIAVRNAASVKKQPRWLDLSRFETCSGLETATFDVDSPFEVITRMRPILKFMTNHLDLHTNGRTINSLNDVRGRILVVCESGNERSPALVAAYLMLLYGIKWHESLNLIHTHRFSVCLNSGMNEMLKTWQGILQAEFDVASGVNTANNSLVQDSDPSAERKRAVKRSVDEAYDSDDTMTEDHEIAVRPGIAPFTDVEDA